MEMQENKAWGDALIWQEQDSPTKKTKKEKQMQREVGINKERRKWQGDRKGRGNKTQQSMMVKEKNGKNDGQEKLKVHKSHRFIPHCAHN